MDALLPSWVLEPQTWDASADTKVVFVRKPTASNLSHRNLNPFLYRNIQNVGTLDDLAALLVSVDWEAKCAVILENVYIL